MATPRMRQKRKPTSFSSPIREARPTDWSSPRGRSALGAASPLFGSASTDLLNQRFQFVEQFF
jgi:hypothetical protein